MKASGKYTLYTGVHIKCMELYVNVAFSSLRIQNYDRNIDHTTNLLFQNTTHIKQCLCLCTSFQKETEYVRGNAAQTSPEILLSYTETGCASRNTCSRDSRP